MLEYSTFFRMTTLGLFWLCFGVLWLVAVLASGGMSAGQASLQAVLAFAASFSLLTALTHLLLEIRLWKRAQLHLLIALPAILIGCVVIVPTLRPSAIGIWFAVFSVLELLVLKTVEPVADWIGARAGGYALKSPPTPHQECFIEGSACDAMSFVERRGADTPRSCAYPQQTWTRYVDEDGRELLEGVVQVAFAPNQRIANVHVPFVPPFAQTPEIEAEPVDEVDVTITIPQQMPHGARIDVKREQCDAVAQIPIAVLVRAR